MVSLYTRRPPRQDSRFSLLLPSLWLFVFDFSLRSRLALNTGFQRLFIFGIRLFLLDSPASFFRFGSLLLCSFRRSLLSRRSLRRLFGERNILVARLFRLVFLARKVG